MPSPRKLVARLLAWTEWLLIGSGAMMLALVALVLIDSHLAQERARASLALPASPSLAASSPLSRSRVTSVMRGMPIGELSIPRVNLSAVVLHGSDASTLHRGPGHIENTSFPGQPGNVAIAGHRDSFFRPLRNVRRGDDVFLDTEGGRFHYRVVALDVVGPNAVSVLSPTEKPTLTLITCYPFWLAGPAPDRFIVRAEEVGGPGEPAAHPVVTNLTVQASELPGEAEPTRTPTPESSVRSRGTGSSHVRASDDRRDVLDAVERFRGIYNARLSRRGEMRDAQALAIAWCDVAVQGLHARAVCADGSPAPKEISSWLFALQRGDTGWSIVSVEPR